AGVVRRQVLRPVHELQLVAVDQRLHRADVGERRQDGHLDLVVVLLRQREGDLLHQRDGLEVVAVHLPVAGDERLPDGHQLLSSTAMPGKVLPSRYSSEAPPPVEMCENPSSGRPSARTAAAESPPPTTLKASESTIACATPRVPSANGASSNTPIGPFQNTVAAPESTSANAATDAGPMSRPFHPSGMASAATVCVFASAENSSATTTSVGSTILPVSSSVRQVSIWSRSSSESPTP